jgi:hypothetical protein
MTLQVSVQELRRLLIPGIKEIVEMVNAYFPEINENPTYFALKLLENKKLIQQYFSNTNLSQINEKIANIFPFYH